MTHLTVLAERTLLKMITIYKIPLLLTKNTTRHVVVSTIDWLISVDLVLFPIASTVESPRFQVTLRTEDK